MTRNMLAACALLGIAGVAVGQTTTGAGGSGARGADAPAAGSRGGAGGMTAFVSADKMRGWDVYGASGDKVADVSDLVIDRGSGRIPYLVLKTDTVLGLGGKAVVVPYSGFQWDAARKRLVLNVQDKDHLKTWPEFDKDSWTRDNRTLSGRLGREYYGDTNSAWRPLTKGDMGSDDRVTGRLKSVGRNTVTDAQEEVVVTITTPEGRDEQVILGPSWYVAGNTLMLTRDQPVEVNVYRADREGKKVAVARSATVNKQEARYYDDQGRPAWASAWNTDAGNDNTAARTGAAYTAPFVLSSEIDGRKLDCRGDACGHIEDLVVECMTGRVAFLAVDPDKGVTGLGDKTRLVPFSVAWLSVDDRVRLDASKTMIDSAVVTPSDFNTLGASWRDVYGPFGVQPVSNWSAPGPRGAGARDADHGSGAGEHGRPSGAHGAGRP